MNRNELKIVSGAQTGVDQGGLLAAIDLGIEWGGWVPKGWRTENGTVPERFRPKMREHASSNYLGRTRQFLVEVIGDGMLMTFCDKKGSKNV